VAAAKKTRPNRCIRAIPETSAAITVVKLILSHLSRSHPTAYGAAMNPSRYPPVGMSGKTLNQEIPSSPNPM